MAVLFTILAISFFFLGLVQVCMAAGLAIDTKNPVLRKHLYFYGLGVLAYFYSMFCLQFMPDEVIQFTLPFFFLTPVGLAIYHIYIFHNRNNF